jgi:dephospho-CoA kinase
MTIGVTGSIGSGKSTVCGLFGEWGATVIDADRIAHSALEESDVQDRVVARFGNDLLDQGQLDRRELGRRAFATDQDRDALTNIVWPAVGRLLKARVAEAGPTHPVVIEAPVLLEWGDPDGLCEIVVVVTGPELIRVERTAARLGISAEEVRDRDRHQMPEEEKIKHADYVIANDSDLDALRARACNIWRTLVDAGNTAREGTGNRRAKSSGTTKGHSAA